MTIKTRNIADGAITAAKIAANTITAAKLSTTMATGFIDLPLQSWRAVASSDYSAVAVDAGQVGSGGVLGADATTAPALIRVNAGTDKTARIVYADGVLTPILNDFVLPADVDVTAALTFKALVAMSSTNSNATVITLVWVATSTGVYAAGANQGGAMTTIGATATSLRVISKSIVAAAINVPGAHVSVELTPDSPGTGLLHIYGTWVEYTRV